MVFNDMPLLYEDSSKGTRDSEEIKNILEIYKNKKQGLTNEIVDDFNAYDFQKADGSVRAVFLETPSNPLLEVTDIRKVGEAAKKRGISFFTFNANANAQQS